MGIDRQLRRTFVVPIPEVIAAVIILPFAGIGGALLLTRADPCVVGAT